MKTSKQIKEMLQFQDLSKEEKERRGILGRLYGPCASIVDATRNGRLYPDALWKKVFNENPIVKEMLANGGIPLELDHPSDREEICSEKIAAMMPEAPKEDQDGHLICYVDLIDTPNGRIAYQLAKYGYKLGISSRGTGDLYTDEYGNESVDPDTYDFTCFDLVLVPAVEEARLAMTESFDTKKVQLHKALTESLATATEEEKKVMENTLKDLNINVLSEEEIPYEDPDTQTNDLLLEEESDEDENNDDNVELVASEEETVEHQDSFDEEDATKVESEVTEEEPSEETAEEPSTISTNEAKEIAVEAVENAVEATKEQIADEEENPDINLKEIDIEEVINEVEEKITEKSEEESAKLLDSDETEEEINNSDEESINIDDTLTTSEPTEEEASVEVEETNDKLILDEPETVEETAIDDGEAEIMESLKEAIRQKDLLEQENNSLKQAKTVSDAEVITLKEELEKYKASFARVSMLASNSSKLEKEIKTLSEQLVKKDSEINELKQNHTARLNESIERKTQEADVIAKKLAVKTTEVEQLNEKLDQQSAKYQTQLNEKVEIAKKYKKKYEFVLNKFIESKAAMLGVRPSEITSRLDEKFTLADIDSVCDKILTESVGISRLPFQTAEISIKEPKVKQVNGQSNNGYDIDDSLLELAGLK